MNRIPNELPRQGGRTGRNSAARAACRLGAVLLAGAAVIAGQSANADLRYTLVDSFVPAQRLPAVSAQVAFHGQAERIDSDVSANGKSVHIVNIVDCASGKQYTYDPVLKIYAVRDATAIQPELFGLGTLLPGYAPGGLVLPLPLATATRPATPVSVVDRGAQRLGHRTTHGWSIALGQGSPGQSTSPYQSIDVWTDPSAPQPIDCAMSRALSAGGYFTGDSAALNSVFAAEPVRIVITFAQPPGQDGPASVETYTVKDESAKGLDGSLFELPSGLTQVTSSEFANQESATVVARLSGSTPENPGNRFVATPVHPGPPNQDTGINFPGQAPVAPTMGVAP